MGRDTNVEIFRDTVDLVKTNPALRAEVAASTKKQEIILETDKVEVPSLSKYEGGLIDRIQKAYFEKADGIIINPGDRGY